MLKETYDNPVYMVPGGIAFAKVEPSLLDSVRLSTEDAAWTRMYSSSAVRGWNYQDTGQGNPIFNRLTDIVQVELRNRCGWLNTFGISRKQILRYEVGEAHGLHWDDQLKPPASIGRTKVVLHLLNQFGALIYDVSEDHTGGEIVFPEQNLTIKPEKGMVVMWPANRHFPHEVLPVKTGTRKAYVLHFYVAN